MKTFNTLRIVPTQDGYLAIQEQVAEVWLEPDDVVCHIREYDLPWKLRNILNSEPEDDNSGSVAVVKERLSEKSVPVNLEDL